MYRAMLVAAIMSFVVLADGAMAQRSETTLNGAQLLKACTTADQEWIGFCNGYIQAAFDAGGGKGICAPKGVTRNQLFDVIIPKLQTAPALLELDAVSVVNGILRKAYPCN
jgi:Rap1a immunity proteins